MNKLEIELSVQRDAAVIMAALIIEGKATDADIDWQDKQSYYAGKAVDYLEALNRRVKESLHVICE